MINYKATSISLGVLDDSTIKSGVSDSPYMPKSTSVPSPLPSTSSPPKSTYPPQPPPTDESQILPEGILLSAEVVSFHSEMEEYWFRVHTVFQPYNPNGSFDLPLAKQHVLYRCYNDFYDFQIELLEKFPREAGREMENPSPRLIPYMPGPVEHVDDGVTLTRKDELDKYLRSLCKLKETTAKYILESIVVREFLAIKPGDAEMEIDPCTEEIQAIFGSGDPPGGYPQELPYEDAKGLYDQMGRMNLNGGYDDGYDNGSSRSNSRAHPYSYNEDAYDRKPPRNHLTSQNHQRSESAASHQHQRISAYSSSPGSSPQPAPTKPKWTQNHPYSGGGWNHPNGHEHDDHFGNGHGRTSVAPVTSPSVTTRSRSHSNAAKLNSPPISATNLQTAFVKIKIFDSITEDLIAIRVHPRVTHTQLMEKVQSRLGAGVRNLKYRESTGGAFVELLDDEELRAWIEATDRHVLYAD
jgi:bud emergence protein 1